jgi:hypothetical protein
MTRMAGSFLFQYYAVDNFGNNETVRNVTIKIDIAKPMLFISTDGFAADGWGNASARVTANGTDDISGIASIFYKVNDGAWTLLSAAFGFALDGTYVVSFYPVDEAGNVGDVVSITLKVDATAPTSAVLVEGTRDVAGTYLGVVNVTISGADVGNGLSELQYRIDGGAWTEYVSKLMLDLSNGTHLIEFRAIDACGNIGTVGSSSVVVMHAKAPGKITDLTVVVKDGGLLLSWTAPTNGGTEITGYSIYRSVGGEAMQLIGTTKGTSYLDTTAEAGTDYQYQVVADNMIGRGLVSDISVGVITKVSTDYTFLFIIAVVVVAGIGAVAFLMMRKKK